MRFFKCVLLYFTLISFHSYAQTQEFSISGTITDDSTGAPLAGVNVFSPRYGKGSLSDQNGYYSFLLPQSDTVKIISQTIGHSPKSAIMVLHGNVVINFKLKHEKLQLQEIVLKGNKYKNISDGAQTSSIELPVEQVKSLPTLMGEKDVFKSLQLMPGVKRGSEGSSGLYVRGGGPGENLIMLDNATVYNPYHLFGFFSSFNGDAIKSIDLIKGGFPSRYGGRLSSVIDLQMRSGNKEKFSGEAGVGLIATRLSLEGPIIKNKASFLVTARRTYVDALIRPFEPKNIQAGYFFHDYTAKLDFDLSSKDKFYISGFYGKDKFYSRSNEYSSRYEASINWSNTTGTANWKHTFNENLSADALLTYSRYNFNIGEEDHEDRMGEDYKYKLKYGSYVEDMTARYHVSWVPHAKHTLNIGILATHHTFDPEAVVYNDTDEKINQKVSNKQNNLEGGLYIEEIYKPVPRLTLNPGIRLSSLSVVGKNYFFPEPRFAAGYKLTSNMAVKASYALMNQYMHQLTNSNIGLPTDLWVPATARIKPARSQQVAAGISRDINKLNTIISIEGYYKNTENILNYKEGISFLDEDALENSNKNNWENKVTRGNGWAYGTEFLIQKKEGKFSGWAGYTLSWVINKFDSLNGGKQFYAKQDRRHDISLVGIYKLSEKVKFAATWVYSTGSPFTLNESMYRNPTHNPSGGMQYPDFQQAYSERNNFRMEAYHRLDFGVQFSKKKKRGTRTWDLSVYNAYNRLNPFYYDYKTVYYSNKITRKLQKVSLFPIIPSITYNRKF